MKRALLWLPLVGCVQPAPSREGSEMLWGDGPPGGTTQLPDDPCDNNPVNPLFIEPRLLSPLSTSRATTRRPTLTWSSCADARVQICADRSCNVVFTTADVVGESWTPTSDLAGNFWRVQARVGSQLGFLSKVWQVNVPAVSAPFSSSGGSVLDADLDGWPEFTAGAVAAEGASGVDSGVVYLYEGARSPSTSPILTLTQPVPQDGALFGFAVSASGDLDGDGIDDLIIGETDANSFNGQVHVLPSHSASTVLANPNPTIDYFGQNLNIVGDVDGDDLADFVVGAPGGDGAAYLVPSTGPILTLTPTGDDAGWVGL
jgi:hypothetical protein